MKEIVDTTMKSIHFFSNDCKPKREVWVVENFLSQLGIAFSKDQIIKSSDEPVDVIYREARFQVKEIMDEGRRRGDELRELLQKAKIATSLSELSEPYHPQEKSCYDLAYFVTDKAAEWVQKYGPSERMSTDLLFYFNLQDVDVVGDKLPAVATNSSKMATWRSVSVTSGDCGIVVHVSEAAPDFLKTAMGKVHRNLQGYFDES